MATAQSPIKDPAGAPTETLAQQQQQQRAVSSSINPIVKSETPATTSSVTAGSIARPVEPETINVPSYSRWFSWNNIHECEIRFLPEFFDGRLPSKNARVYKYYRNSIIQTFRENPSRKLTFTDVRKILVGDVGSIRRVFDFLEAWGLINYTGSALKQPLKWEDKDNKSGGPSSQSSDAGGGSIETIPKRKWCSGCKSLCSIACFACDKFDLTLCARCYVRGNYRVGVSSSDFRRVEISEETRAGWTDKETLHLLEAVLHYGDDWKKVAEHVGNRNEKECVTHFIKLSFGEQFLGHGDFGVDSKLVQMKREEDAKFGQENVGAAYPSKKMRLNPLSDASNPIMAQAAFLSALVGVEVAEAAARAAVASLSEVDLRKMKEGLGSFAKLGRVQEPGMASNGDTTSNTLEAAFVEAKSQLEKEELDVENAISSITEVQMKEIEDKIVRIEELELHMEKEWQQLHQMKNMLFVDQLTLLFQKSSAPKSGEPMVGDTC